MRASRIGIAVPIGRPTIASGAAGAELLPFIMASLSARVGGESGGAAGDLRWLHATAVRMIETVLAEEEGEAA